MARLLISLLGPFQATLDGEPIAGFKANKARALLAYLAVEAHLYTDGSVGHPRHPIGHPRPHPRQALAGLLWPSSPERAALTNLRTVLADLRSAIGDRDAAHTERGMPPFLQITRETIRFNPASDHWLDVATFQTLVETAASDQPAHQRLAEAITLYRGDLLEGFFVRNSPQFEDWVLLLREKLHWQALQALGALAAYHEGRGAFEEAIACARRQVALEPWHEGAYRRWMRCLAASGRRGAALAQYENCRQVLAEELGVDPEDETATLYEQIRVGALAPLTVAGPRIHAVGAPEEAPIPSPPPVGGGILEGERRIVTVVRAEVDGSPAPLSRLDAEDRAAFVGRFLRAAGAEVHRFGGEVDRYDSQGLLAFFGARMAHEDDAERAVLAALAMQTVFHTERAELAQDEADWRAPDDPGLRVGVHTGEAMVTLVEEDGHQRERRAVMGDAVSSVNHVLALAPPGEVRVSAATHRLVQPLFEWDREEKSRRPLRHKAPLDKGRGIEGLTSPLVGRDAEMRVLQKAVTRLRDGSGGIITIVGEAGIGKSRLVAEIRSTQYGTQGAATAAGNLQWVEGRCLSYGETMAYLPWIGVLHALLGVTADDTPAAVGRALRQEARALCADRFEATYAYLGRLLSVPLDAQAEAIIAHANAEDLQGGTFYAVELLLERAAALQPLVVVCEDLHWADPTSLALLERLLPLTERVPALFLCVFRPQKDRGCWRIREAAERRYGDRHIHLSLDPLTEQESAELVGHLLHVENLPQKLRARILEHAQGNPFYVEEVLRALIDAAADGGAGIAHDETTGRWFATRDAVDIPVPDTLYGVLRARIDHLPAGARHVLQLASVAGRVFSQRLLADIAQRDELGAHLVTLQRMQMIRERSRVPEAEYIFKHQLTLEAAYDSLLHRARRTLHRRVADALARLYPDQMEEQPGLLGYHWERAGESARAVDCLRRAGERAEARYAVAEAASYYGRALALVPKTDLAAQYDLLMARSRGYGRVDTQAADVDLAALEHLAEALADPYKKAEVLLRRAERAFAVDDVAAGTAAAREAIATARAIEAPRIEALAYFCLANASFSIDRDWTEVRQHYEQALAVARTHGLRSVEAQILRRFGINLGLLAHPAAAQEALERAAYLQRELGSKIEQGRVLTALSLVYRTQGELQKARQCCEQGLQLCQATGNRYDEAWACAVTCWVAKLQGEYAEAMLFAERALVIFRQLDYAPGERRSLVDLGWIRWYLGDYDAATVYLQRGLEVATKESLAVGLALTCLGLISHRLGDDQAALEYGRRALSMVLDMERRWLFPLVGYASIGLEDLDRAADVCREAVTVWERMGLRNLASEPLAGLAHSAHCKGNRAEALAHVKEILGYLEDPAAIGEALDPFWINITCVRVLRANQDPRADEVLGQAYERLQGRAAKIEDPDLRRSYLQNVPAHREIVVLWEQRARLSAK